MYFLSIMVISRREFLQRIALVPLAAALGYNNKSFASTINDKKTVRDNEKFERRRIGLESEDVLTECLKSNEGYACGGISCPMYQRCWEHLKPDKDGFYES
tara:strand:- start:5019 stop:5321 length:303 start_codon:yes stop_codon:yes gene_type:complete